MPLSAPAHGFQTTLRAPIQGEGIGIHHGQQARVTVRPAPADTGLAFLLGAIRVPARAAFVLSTRRCTTLGIGEARVDTVEHLLSALHGLEIDNAEIEVEGPEIPILDGSARLWGEQILSAGTETLSAERRALRLAAPVALREGESWLIATPADAFSITCVTHFDHPLLGTQADTFAANPARYAREIAPARTFAFAAEVEALRAAGLARGGSLDNALIVYDDRFSDALRVPDECLRHKALDLWGDLALAGTRICAAITAIKPGHRANVAFAALLSGKEGNDA